MSLPVLYAAAGGAGTGAGFWGTLEYVAPEVAMHGAAAYSPVSDWWGLGVLMYELLLGLVPWDGEDSVTMLEQIKQADVLWPPEGIVSVVDKFVGQNIRGGGGGVFRDSTESHRQL